MKNNYLYINLIIALAIASWFVVPQFHEVSSKYKPRSAEDEITYSANEAINYLMRIRTNQNTKTIDIADVQMAQHQLKSLSSKKNTGSDWIFRGPDNIGGRTRALLIDKDNSNILFAGGVSGGLWKSTTSGQHWEPVHYDAATSEDFANLAVVSICQAANGDIYFGTGEGLHWNHGTNTATPMFIGAGIWKSSDRGATFTKLNSTSTNEGDDTFSLVYKLAADPSNQNLVYASTLRGLKVSTNGGTSWEPAPLDNSIYNTRVSTDVKVATDGSVIASIGNICFVKKAGQSEFVTRSGSDIIEDPEAGHLITKTDVGRMEFAYAPQDPSTVFCAVAAQDESLRNIYKSADGGDNWVIIGKGGSALFQPFGSQGIYDICIAVNPANKNEVFVGGLDIWFGKAANTGNLFAWSQVTLWNSWVNSPLYVHADQHTIVFDPKDPQIMFVGSDGGIGRGYINKDGVKYQFKTMNNNYNVTQFYSIAANSYGFLFGGTQDNGSLLVAPGYGNTDETGFQILGGDGGHTVMSQIMPNIAFGTIYFGGLWRNNDQGYSDWNTFYSSDLADYQNWSSGTWEADKREASFVTPITYWETKNDEYSKDSVMHIARIHFPKDTSVVFYSHNIHKAPIRLTLDKEYFEGDTIWYHDSYSALFALGMKREVWITRKGANWNEPIAQRDWWKALKKNTLGADEVVEQLRFSSDGDHLFFSTSDNELYRISNLNMARTFNEADYIFGKKIITTLTKIGGFGNRAITGIACDPNNPDNLIITLGNYGNEEYAYLCTEATSVGTSSSFSNFVSITGNLPKVPTYCALFEMEESGKRVFLGTDLGVFISDDLFAQVLSTENGGTINWIPDQAGVGPVPVFQMTQITIPNYFGTFGKIYIGTHGRGFFENDKYVSIPESSKTSQSSITSKLNVSAYPNPVNSETTLSFSLDVSAEVHVSIVSLNGQIIRSIDAGYSAAGDSSVKIDLSGIAQGAYLVKVQTDNKQGVVRIVKR